MRKLLVILMFTVSCGIKYNINLELLNYPDQPAIAKFSEMVHCKEVEKLKNQTSTFKFICVQK